MKTAWAFACALLLATQGTSHAGSPGGLALMVAGSDRAAAYTSNVHEFFASYQPDSGNMDCDNEALNIDKVYYKEVAGVTEPALQSALTDGKQRKALGRSLEKFRSNEYKRGFDGVLFFDVKGDSLLLHGISAWSKEKIHTSSIKLSDREDKNKFNVNMCRAIVKMPVLQQP